MSLSQSIPVLEQEIKYLRRDLERARDDKQQAEDDLKAYLLKSEVVSAAREVAPSEQSQSFRASEIKHYARGIKLIVINRR